MMLQANPWKSEILPSPWGGKNITGENRKPNDNTSFQKWTLAQANYSGNQEKFKSY